MNSVTLQMLLYQNVNGPSMPVFDTQSQKLAVNYLIVNGLMDNTGAVTAKGRCHIKAILDAPLPVAEWKSPITKE